MDRTSPCYHIAPGAISVTPNANGKASDLAVYIAKGAQIRVYSIAIVGLGMEDSTWQSWSLTGRNRRLSDDAKPYTIYARLSKNNKADGYLIFAPKVQHGNSWYDKYSYVTMHGLALNTENLNNSDYWYIKLGDVSLPDNGVRSVDLDTGILGTDQFNTEYNLDPDDMPLRVELSATLDGNDAGDKPYVPWGKELILRAKLLEGWSDADVARLHHWTIQRNTGDNQNDLKYNYPSATTDNPAPSSGRQMLNGDISLSHARGEGDVFNGSVSSTWTVIAWGIKQTDSSSSDSDSSNQSISSNLGDSSNLSSSSNLADTSNSQYEALAQSTINIMAETVEHYALELSTSVVNYDPTSDTYNPLAGVDVMVRATDQRGEVFKMTKAQVDNASIAVQYSVGDLNQWTTCEVEGNDTDVATANIPIDAFHLQKNVTVRIVKVWQSSDSKDQYTEICRTPIAFVRNGEDSKVREWIYLRSKTAISFSSDKDDKTHPLIPSLIAGGEVKPEEAATGEDTNKNQDGWVPQGWWDDMQGTDSTYHYEYAAYRDYIKSSNVASSSALSKGDSSSANAAQRGGHWGDFSTPRIWSYYAEDAVSYRCRWTLAGVEVYQLKCAYTGAFRGTLPLVATLMKRVGSSGEQEVTGKAVIVVSCDGIDFSKTLNAPSPSFIIATDNADTKDFIQYLNNVALNALSVSFTVDGEEHKFSIPVIREADKDSVESTIDEYSVDHLLRKDQPDSTPFTLGMKVANIDEQAKSTNFDNHVGFPFGTGWAAIKDDGSGASMLEVDKLFVRMKAYFAELEIRKISYLGGNYVFSSAGGKIYYVEWLDAHKNVLEKTDANRDIVDTFRCYLYSDDGTTQTMNWFKVDDQVRCQNFGDLSKTAKAANGVITAADYTTHYWWRRVNAVGNGVIAAKGDNRDYQYIEFWNKPGQYGADSDFPEIGDAMVQFGNWTTASRQGVIMIVVTGDDAPAIIEWQDVGANGKHFTMPENEYTRLSPRGDGNIIRGKFISVSGTTTDNTGKSLDEQINALVDQLNDIKNQADKKFDIWFNGGEPHPNSATDTETNAPASDWTTDAEKGLHAQDLYYDTDKAPASKGGRAWRWMAHTVNDAVSYYWDEVTDKDTNDALEKAATLQNQVDDASSDCVISAGNEKSQLLKDWNEVAATYKSLSIQVSKAFGSNISQSGFPNLYTAFMTLAQMLNDGAKYTSNDYSAIPKWVGDDFEKDTYLADYTENSNTKGVLKSIYTSSSYRSIWKSWYEALVAVQASLSVKTDPRNAISAMADKIYDISGGYIESGNIKVFLGTEGNTTGDGYIRYYNNAVSRYSDGAWSVIDNDGYNVAFDAVYNAVGIYGITVSKAKTTSPSKYDLVIRKVLYSDKYQQKSVEGNIEILMYNGTSWEMLRESTRAIIENLGDEIRGVVYGPDGEGGDIASGIRSVKGLTQLFSEKFNFDEKGNVTNIDLSGVVATADFNKWKEGDLKGLLDKKLDADAFAGLYAAAVKADDTIVKTASMSVYVTKDGDNYISNAKIKADNIELEGLVTANSYFKVLEDGSIEAANANISGTINATKGEIGNFYIGYDGLYAGTWDTKKAKTISDAWFDTENKENICYLNSSSLWLEQQVGYFESGDIAYMMVGLGRGSDPTTKGDKNGYCSSAMYIYRNMMSKDFEGPGMYYPAAKIISKNAFGCDIALRVVGGLQVHGGVIEKGYSLEYTATSQTNVLDLSKGTTFLLYTSITPTVSGHRKTYASFYFPTLTKLRYQLGISDTSTSFSVKVTIISRKDTQDYMICTQKGIDGVTDAEAGILVDNNGNEWKNSQNVMFKGDCTIYALNYTPSTGYYAQKISDAS